MTKGGLIDLGRTVRASAEEAVTRGDSHVSHMACSQHGSRKAFTASLLQIAHLSLMGMSSGVRELVHPG